MSLWKNLSLSILIFIALLLGTVVYLFSTTSGLHILFNAANHWIPGLEIGKVTGGWRNLNLKKIHYQQPGIIFNADEFHLSLKLSCLRNGKLCINDLSLKDVNINIDSKKIPASPAKSITTEEEDNSLLDFSVFHQILFCQVILENVNINIDNVNASIIHFSSGLHWQKKNLTLTPTLLHGLLITLPKVNNLAHGEIFISKIQELKSKKKMLSKALKDLFSKPILSEINNIYLPLNFNIEEFRGEQLRLISNIDLNIFKIILKASNIDGKLKFNILDINTNQGSMNATGSMLLRDKWPVDINLNNVFSTNSLNDEKMQLKINGALRDKLNLNINFSGQIDMMLYGQIKLVETGLPFNLELISQRLFLPFIDTKQFQADDLKLKLSGKITNYNVLFRALVKGQSVPPITVTFDAKGNEHQIRINKFTVAILNSKIELISMVDWQKAINWCGNLKFTDIKTTEKILGWPLSNLDGLIEINGSSHGNNWQIDLSKINITGNVKQNKILVDGSLKGNSCLQWIIPSLRISLGRNIIDIKGELGVKDYDLIININAKNLSNILSWLGGEAKGMIKLYGTVKAPKLLTNIKANNLQWKNVSISQLLIDGDIKSTDQVDGKFNLRVENIVQPRRNINLITLIANGSEKQHNIKILFKNDSVFGHFYLIGSLDRQMEHWKGHLHNIKFNTPIGMLMLSHAIALDYQNIERKVRIGPHCWTNSSIELCVPQTIDAGIKGNAVVNLNYFNTTIVKQFMLNSIQASGFFRGKFNLTWDITKKNIIQSSIILFGRNLKLTQIINKAPLTVVFDTLNLNAYLNNDCVYLGWLINLDNNGKFKGQIQLNGLQEQRNLNGIINISNFNLATANAIISDDDEIAGLINANLKLTGNMQNPQIFGQVKFDNIEINGKFVPFYTKSKQMTISFNGTSAILIGEVYTSNGKISLKGHADWSQIDKWFARVTAKGSSVRIAISSIAQIDISPNVIFKVTPNLFTIDGNLEIPWAYITIHDLSKSAINVSSDEVLLNENLEPVKQKSKNIHINSNLIIHMGNNVRLDAFGLKTKLTGDLKLTQDKQGIRLNGNININEGRFRAYGQDLIVRKGELMFSGPPEQPVLNIEAIRNPNSIEDNVTVGVRITGYVDKPKTEIFSDPSMLQQEVLSYLLYGHRLNSDQNDNLAITSILISLWVKQSKQIIVKIGEIFGLSNLTLETQGVGDSSRVVISGYVLPNLQVEYGVGIFNSLATFKLRYHLMHKLYLEAVSGVYKTLNLLYQFEF